MINKNKYLVAVSGGPDSMALLDILYNKGYQLCVAHVNYHKRDTANRDEEIARDYCKEKDIAFYKLDVNEYQGNFQDYARVIRYKFFAQIIKENDLSGVMVAHHFDDLLETYLMQKKRKAIVNYYGLAKEVIIQDVRVIRPLLSYTKKQLQDYCDSRNINYGIDESNLTDHYQRNRIRHQVIEKMSLSDKKKLKKEIDTKNTLRKKQVDKAKKYLKNKTKIDYQAYLKYDDKKELLRLLIEKDLSDKYLEDLLKQINQVDKLKVTIGKQYLVKEYGYLEVFTKGVDFNYEFSELVYGMYPYFSLNLDGTSFEGMTINKDDLPIIIRNYKTGDEIKMRYGSKKVSRFLIDHKIPSKLRSEWLVVENKNKEIIFVEGMGCDINHYSNKHNLYVKSAK